MKLVSSRSTRSKKKKKKSGGGKAALVLLVLLVLLAGGIGGYAWYAASDCDTILPNISAYGVELGGLTEAEAVVQLEATLRDQDEILTIAFNTGRTLAVAKAEMIEGYDAMRAARTAYAYGRTEGKVSPLQYLKCMLAERELFPEAGDGSLNETRLRELIADAARDVNSQQVDSAYSVNGTTLTIVKGATGVLVDEEAVFRLAKTALEEQNYSLLSYQPDTSTPAPLSVADIHRIVCTPPVEAEFNPDFTIRESRSGLHFDADAAQQLYDNAADGEEITVPLIVLEPWTSTETLQALLYRDQLSAWTSDLTDNETRSKNVELAAEACNDYILLPGEVFSYNDVVGERTTERGFGGAPAYFAGKTVIEVGGGICQVSSAIYYCSLKANLEIVYRTCHLYVASYVPLGMDATVSWGGPEFKFRNNTEYPIKILTWREDDQLHCEFYGTKTDDSYVEMSYLIKETYTPQTVYKEDDSVKPGHTRTETSPITGYKVETYRALYSGDGTLIKRVLEDESVYSRRDRVVLVAPGELHIYDPNAAPPSPSVEPTVEPTAEPTVEPTAEPTAEPTTDPTADPTETEAPTAPPASGSDFIR